MLSQKEITLRNDLSLDDRLGIYRNFFIYCMTGHVTVLPMGATSTQLYKALPFSSLSLLLLTCSSPTVMPIANTQLQPRPA